MKKVDKSSSAIAKAEGSTNVDSSHVCQPNAKHNVSSRFQTLDPGNIALIQQTTEGRILQIGLTQNQSMMLQNFLAILSKDSPLVQMGEDWDLILKSSVCKRCKSSNEEFSPNNTNAVLSAKVFRKKVWEKLENLEKGKCFKSDVMDVIDAYLETSEITRADFIEKTCPYCKKKSIFKPQELKHNEVEVFYCSNCDSYMNGF